MTERHSHDPHQVLHDRQEQLKLALEARSASTNRFMRAIHGVVADFRELQVLDAERALASPNQETSYVWPVVGADPWGQSPAIPEEMFRKGATEAE